MTERPEIRTSYALPANLGGTLLRGTRCRCPRCGDGKLFHAWLKPRDHCPVCALDISGQRADDFPAYIAMFVTGHLLAPIIIALVLDFDLSAGALVAIILPLAVAMMIALLQPAKGAVIALQWWNGMHGFRRERAQDDDEGVLK
ncbi:DUF983 domain-containing protein [Qipengyuania zhejiangensis]|uniref:DUF983 domain-containing protein n=1 Tax=Qipengyuania zhejiangensis TaxID=3077782 RepID=UPI002D79C13D|nr:DUF983 domain-containing protein [Qipengyuania sp. Z2]